ncbi:MAG: hypothetical protein M3Y12_01010 [Bacteroidota bacterium]|nr:hypothetical protein [Bacteroidota bacterium]
MKRLLLATSLLFAAPAAHAQLLPVPGAKNPDWKLEKAETRPETEPLVLLPGMDQMPNAAQRSIASADNHHYWWDGTRQLAYDWLSRPSSGSIAPDKAVAVREERTGTTYIFRRR